MLLFPIRYIIIIMLSCFICAAFCNFFCSLRNNIVLIELLVEHASVKDRRQDEQLQKLMSEHITYSALSRNNAMREHSESTQK